MIVSLFTTIGMQNIIISAYEELTEEILASAHRHEALLRIEAEATTAAMIRWQQKTGNPGVLPSGDTLIADLMERIRVLEMEAEALRK